MDDGLYRFLKYTAIVLTLAWLGWAAYDSLFASVAPGDRAFNAGERAFADGDYQTALRDYDSALREAPTHRHALRGRARALLQLGRYAEALQAFDTVIAQEPDFAASYANRGILHDRMGKAAAALADYERALALDPTLADGPNWMTRFLRLQADKPPTIADRARYLRLELAKPDSARLLHVPELDARQRPYKQ